MSPSAPALPKTHYIDLVRGKFDRTTVADLDAAFCEFSKGGTNHLCVFFHGGLVGRRTARKQAEWLIGGYEGAGAYPFFFIWNSDLLSTLGGALAPFEKNIVFRRVIEQHIAFIASKMLDALDPEDKERSPLWAIAHPRQTAVPPSLATLAARGRVVDQVWAQRPKGITLTIPPAQRAAFEKELVKVLRAHRHILAKRKRFTVRMGLDIIGRVIRRYRAGRDHGLYTTLIEEIYHAVNVDRTLGAWWTRMKSHIDRSFDASSDSGGTAFLARLAAMKGVRLTLIGHSAGVIYVNRMVEALETLSPDFKADVIYIAGALSFETLAGSIAAFKNRVTAFRSFALQDKIEAGYAEAGPVYDKSTLYFISSLCENDSYMDKELVGMERYWERTSTYGSADVRAIRALIPPIARVWSPTDPNAPPPPGFRASAIRHVGFAQDKETNGSVECFLVSP
jgi:hypothetical protein